MQDKIQTESYVSDEMRFDPRIQARIRSMSLPFRDCTTPHSYIDHNGTELQQKLDAERKPRLGRLCLGLSVLAMCVIALHSFLPYTSDNT